MNAWRTSDRLIAQQTVWLGATSGIQLVGGVAHILFGTRILGAAGFGALAVVMATAALIHSIIAIPGSDTVTTFANRSLVEGRPREAGALVRFVVFVSTGLSLVAFLVICAVGLLAGDLVLVGDTHISVLVLYGLVGVFLATNSSALAVLRIADNLRASFVVACADNLVRLGILAAAWVTGGGLVAVVSASVAGAAVSGVGMLVAATLCARKAGFAGLLDSLSLRVPKDAAKFHFTMFGRTTVGALAHNVDTVLLAQFVGASDVGLYRASRHLVDMARQPFNLIGIAVQPVLSRLWFDRQGAQLRGTIRRFTAFSAAFAVLGFAALALIREEIAVSLLGVEFAGVAPLILILIPGAFASSLAVPATLPLAVGRSMPALASSASGLVAVVTAMWFLAPTHGVVGGAWARTILMVVAFAVLMPAFTSIVRESRRL